MPSIFEHLGFGLVSEIEQFVTSPTYEYNLTKIKVQIRPGLANKKIGNDEYENVVIFDNIW